MKILGIDSSAKSASVAVIDNDKILSEFFINTGHTHSQTLMPMINDALKCANISVNDIDLFAVNKGPGSFTGIRIGIATVKGMADVCKKPCIGISTLEAMSYNLLCTDCIACCVMDARCKQVYCALFEIHDGNIDRLTEDSAISIQELQNILKKYEKNKIFVGDGAELCYNELSDKLSNVYIAPENIRYQRASGVCLVARGKDSFVEAEELVPEYLRLSQAERELNAKKNN